ncbi:MAG: hypothetical protein U5K79_14915 [Cyclobacteriaceae bacterium]|nr:hypothetical protein [Cyclobacteriaceae bacterium]
MKKFSTGWTVRAYSESGHGDITFSCSFHFFEIDAIEDIILFGHHMIIMDVFLEDALIPAMPDHRRA